MINTFHLKSVKRTELDCFSFFFKQQAEVLKLIYLILKLPLEYISVLGMGMVVYSLLKHIFQVGSKVVTLGMVSVVVFIFYRNEKKS